MLSTAPRHRPYRQRLLHQGFTLVEMMVTIAVLIISLGISLPSMNDWLRNSKVNAISSNLQSALRSGHNDAIRRSRMVIVLLTSNTPAANTLPALSNGNPTFWATYTIPINGSDEPPELLNSGTLKDIDSDAQIQGPAAVCFNSLGRLSATSIAPYNCTLPVQQTVHAFEVTNTQAQRKPRVTVGLNGDVKACDRSREAGKHPNACPLEIQPGEDEDEEN